jgi:hypothetical protein
MCTSPFGDYQRQWQTYEIASAPLYVGAVLNKGRNETCLLL